MKATVEKITDRCWEVDITSCIIKNIHNVQWNHVKLDEN